MMWPICPAHKEPVSSKKLVNSNTIERFEFQCGCVFDSALAPSRTPTGEHNMAEWKQSNQMGDWEYARWAYRQDFRIPTKGHHLWTALGRLIANHAPPETSAAGVPNGMRQPEAHRQLG